MFHGSSYRQCPSGTVQYSIKSGDTLATVAKRYNTTVGAILTANPTVTAEQLKLGQVICIPSSAVQAPTCPIGSSPYVIKAGDTLASIAARFYTTPAAILTTNPGIMPDRLLVGQVICIAQVKPATPKCPTMNFYVIRTGDTLYSISRVFTVSMADLLRVNPGINPSNLYDGKIICIPLAPSPVSITVSIQAKLLSLYRQGSFIKAYPVATGKPTTPSPVGTFTIVNKQLDPGGPFGTRWMGLSEPHYGIHGNNNPPSIGTAASNGCIRMYNKDVEDLFNLVPVGTVVRIF